jgi:prepilin-type N-terminal cleavage/methylation domain-containing protein
MISTTHSPALRPDLKRARRRGFTLVEVLIAAGLSAFIMTGVLTAFLFLGRSGATLQNYNDMEAQSRRALELFAEDVRQASAISWTSATEITLTVNSSSVTYSYASGNFNRQVGSGPAGAIISGIIDGTFSFRAFNVAGTEIPLDSAAALTTAGTATKQLQISLRSARSRATLATATNTVLSARFILRNKIVTA